MTTRVAQAIKQTRPFASEEHEVFVALQRLASDLSQGVAELLKPSGISGPQYNVLRILRGAGPTGLPCGEIGGRLVTRDPDVTRLLDRLEKQGLVTRSRESEDRRVVTTRITDAGVALLATLDDPLAALHRRQLGHLGSERLRQLRELIDLAAAPSASDAR